CVGRPTERISIAQPSHGSLAVSNSDCVVEDLDSQGWAAREPYGDSASRVVKSPRPSRGERFWRPRVTNRLGGQLWSSWEVVPGLVEVEAAVPRLSPAVR